MAFCFFKQKTAYELRISDWSSDVCSSDLVEDLRQRVLAAVLAQARARNALQALDHRVAFVVLQFDLELGLGADLGHAPTPDVAFVLPNLCAGHLVPGGLTLPTRIGYLGPIPMSGQTVGAVLRPLLKAYN